MSELQYGRIPELEAKLELATESETQETTLLKNKVTENEIADVLSRWTGIPVFQKCLKAKKSKLLSMEAALHKTRCRAGRSCNCSNLIAIRRFTGWVVPILIDL